MNWSLAHTVSFVGAVVFGLAYLCIVIAALCAVLWGARAEKEADDR